MQLSVDLRLVQSSICSDCISVLTILSNPTVKSVMSFEVRIQPITDVHQFADLDRRRLSLSLEREMSGQSHLKPDGWFRAAAQSDLVPPPRERS
jgi:hypothetical protein